MMGQKVMNNFIAVSDQLIHAFLQFIPGQHSKYMLTV